MDVYENGDPERSHVSVDPETGNLRPLLHRNQCRGSQKQNLVARIMEGDLRNLTSAEISAQAEIGLPWPREFAATSLASYGYSGARRGGLWLNIKGGG